MPTRRLGGSAMPRFMSAIGLFWSDVSDLFRRFYSPPSSLPPKLDAAIADLAERHCLAEDRMVEALRFVRRLLRYHSVGMGAGGFKPRIISDIWSSRYGDCKDASHLLAAMLGRLNVEACPALVSTVTGRGLDKALQCDGLRPLYRASRDRRPRLVARCDDGSAGRVGRQHHSGRRRMGLASKGERHA